MTIKIIRAIIAKLRKNLKDNEIFLSEDDLKFSFAMAAKELGATNVILEYPIMTRTLYEKQDESFKRNYMYSLKNKDCVKSCVYNKKCSEECYMYENNRTYIDVYFKFKGEEYFVELKYKTILLGGCTRHDCKNEFTLAQQGGGHYYYIYEDIERMENIKKINPNCNAYTIIIANEKYWGKKDKKKETKIKKFSLCETDDYKQKISYKTEHNEAVCYEKYENQTSFGDLEYIDKRKPRHILHIDNPYFLEWKLFKRIECKTPQGCTKKKCNREKEDYCGNFKYLLIDLNKPQDN